MTAPDFPLDFLDTLDRTVRDRDGKPERHETRFQCPADGHPDIHPSARWNRKKATWRCDVCGAGGGALDLADLLGIERPPLRSGGAGAAFLPKDTATAQPASGDDPPGCTLLDYATAKQLDLRKLRAFGLTEITYLGAPAVRIPYLDRDRRETAVQFRVRLTKSADGADRFKWRSGSKACLYGLDRLDLARECGFITLVEGASDCHTLWAIDQPAIGLPGANTWNEQRDAAHLDGIDRIYVVIEPDRGGEAVAAWIATSRIRDRVMVLDLDGHKDPSALYLDDPATFGARWAAARAAATPFIERERAAAEEKAAAAWATCADLAGESNVLDRMVSTLARSGVVGEARALKLIYLAVTSRFLSRPVSVAVKGPSSGGKSHTVEKVLDLFPDDAYFSLTAMSERSLAYSEEPLDHRMLVIYEAAGMAGEFASYLMRSLLSEGCIRYETVEKTADGMRARLIERPGPTGLIVTTTAVHLHPENETRMLSLSVDDSTDQTRRVLRALAGAGDAEAIDTTAWHALQIWMAGAENRTEIPFARVLSELASASAVRFRRDFELVLNLIRAHAALHQATRERDAEGRIVATIEGDYASVHALVADLLAEGAEAAVSATVRETVRTVGNLLHLTGHNRADEDDEPTVTVATIAKALHLDKSAALRRVRVAIDREYLKNLETRKGRPARIAMGDALPADVPVLPPVADLLDGCTVAARTEGVSTNTGAEDAASAEPDVTDGSSLLLTDARFGQAAAGN